MRTHWRSLQQDGAQLSSRRRLTARAQAIHEYQVVGRHKPTETDPKPNLYRMRIFAPNEVVAKSRYWYFLSKYHKMKKTTGEILAVNEIHDRKPDLVKNYAIFVRYDSRSGTHNLYKEFRDTTRCGAVAQMCTSRLSSFPLPCWATPTAPQRTFLEAFLFYPLSLSLASCFVGAWEAVQEYSSKLLPHWYSAGLTLYRPRHGWPPPCQDQERADHRRDRGAQLQVREAEHAPVPRLEDQVPSSSPCAPRHGGPLQGYLPCRPPQHLLLDGKRRLVAQYILEPKSSVISPRRSGC